MEFSEEHCIILDSKDGKISKEDALLLNSLEDVNNPYRMIFVVNMLNEDGMSLICLILLDCMILEMEVGQRKVRCRLTTVSEMQLIGRGQDISHLKQNLGI